MEDATEVVEAAGSMGTGEWVGIVLVVAFLGFIATRIVKARNKPKGTGGGGGRGGSGGSTKEK